MSLDDLEKLIQSGPKDAAGPRPVVVVIDDDESIRSSLEAVLKEEYQVITCKNAVEGVRAVSEETDCVILDVKMPTHDGFWVCRQLRSRDPDVPIIFHSAYQDLKDPYEVINEFRPFGYIVKGDTLSALLALVANATRSSQRIRDGRRTLGRLRQARAQMRDVHGKLSSVTSTPPPPPAVPRTRK